MQNRTLSIYSHQFAIGYTPSVIRAKTRFFISICYLVAISFLLLVPRSRSQSVISGGKISNTASINLASNQSSIYGKIIYLHGALEKIGNIIIFFLLFFVVSYLFPRLKFGAVSIICCMVSAGVETIQTFIPGRFSSVSDLASNVTGALVPLVLVGKFPSLARSIRGERSNL